MHLVIFFNLADKATIPQEVVNSWKVQMNKNENLNYSLKHWVNSFVFHLWYNTVVVTKSLVSLTQLLNSAGNFSVLQELREVLEGKE